MALFTAKTGLMIQKMDEANFNIQTDILKKEFGKTINFNEEKLK
jgi:hypothetical protein